MTLSDICFLQLPHRHGYGSDHGHAPTGAPVPHLPKDASQVLYHYSVISWRLVSAYHPWLGENDPLIALPKARTLNQVLRRR